MSRTLFSMASVAAVWIAAGLALLNGLGITKGDSTTPVYFMALAAVAGVWAVGEQIKEVELKRQ